MNKVKELIAKIRKYAMDHYYDGWDFIVESVTDRELLDDYLTVLDWKAMEIMPADKYEEIWVEVRDYDEAIKVLQDHVDIHSERKAEIKATVY